MKVKKLLKVLDPTTPVVIIEHNNHNLCQAQARTIYSEYPSDYLTWRLLNRQISMIQTDGHGVVAIILQKEKKDERKNYN